jgi:septum formation protein
MIQNKKIILGSQSPRRQELLKQLGIEFEIEVLSINEIYPPDLSPYDVPEYLANLKSDQFSAKRLYKTCVITSDTVVIYNERILGKPLNKTDALSMIMELSNKEHYVITGVCLKFENKKKSFSSISKVEFEKISEAEANYYINTFEPLDKAGGYGIQEWIGQARIKKIDGCYYNIMGLPLNQLYNNLVQENVITF